MKKILYAICFASILFQSCLKRDNEVDAFDGGFPIRYTYYELIEEQCRDGVVTPGERFHLRIHFNVGPSLGFRGGTITLLSNSPSLNFEGPNSASISEDDDCARFNYDGGYNAVPLSISQYAPIGTVIIVKVYMTCESDGSTETDSFQLVVGESW